MLTGNVCIAQNEMCGCKIDFTVYDLLKILYQIVVICKEYNHLTGFDALLIDRVVHHQSSIILSFLCTRKCLKASSLKHVVFVQK